MNVQQFIESAKQYSPATIESTRRSLILSVLQAALQDNDITIEDDMEDVIERLSKTFVQLKNVWAALKKEKPQGVV
jgi:hypothetical protein